MLARGPRRNPIRGFQGRERPQKKELEKKQQLRSITIQLGPGLKGNSIKEIAMNARSELRYERDYLIEKKFFIVGYSFGVNIALELAAILEKEGNTGVVHCIDSSPEALRVTLETVLGRVSEDQLQNHVLNHMYNLITGKMGKELKRDLKGIPTFDAKVEECLRRMREQNHPPNPIIEKYRRLVLESAYRRIVMAQEYKPEIKLRSQLVLKKSSKNMVTGKLPYDYDLSKYSQEPVKVSPLIATDYDTSYNPRVTNIVNLFIDMKKQWDVISDNKYVRVSHQGILNL